MVRVLDGFLTDSFLSRYLTIIIFTVVQASRTIILSISKMAPGLRPPTYADLSASKCMRPIEAQLHLIKELGPIRMILQLPWRLVKVRKRPIQVANVRQVLRGIMRGISLEVRELRA